MIFDLRRDDSLTFFNGFLYLFDVDLGIFKIFSDICDFLIESVDFFHKDNDPEIPLTHNSKMFLFRDTDITCHC